MSPTDWSECPKCVVKAQESTDSVLREVKNLYGKVPRDEYEAKLKKAEARLEEFKHQQDTFTLREDYELGFFLHPNPLKGFFVHYRAQCIQCGFEYSYDYESGSFNF